MATAYIRPGGTTASFCMITSDDSDPPVNKPLHPYVDDAIPPGSQSEYFCTNSRFQYWYFTLHPDDIPADLDKTGDSGFGFASFYSTIEFISEAAIEYQGYIAGSPVTNLIRRAYRGIVTTKWFAIPAEDITKNWDGSKGYLTRDDLLALELRLWWKNGAPGDIDPPEYG